MTHKSKCLLLRKVPSFHFEYPFPFIFVLCSLIDSLNQPTEQLSPCPSPSPSPFAANLSHFTLQNLHNSLMIQVGGCTINHGDTKQCVLLRSSFDKLAERRE